MGILAIKRSRASKSAQAALRKDFRAAIETFKVGESFTFEDLIPRIASGVLSDDPRSHAGVLIKKELAEKRVARMPDKSFKRLPVSGSDTTSAKREDASPDAGGLANIPPADYARARVAFLDWILIPHYGIAPTITAGGLQACPFFSPYTRDAIGVFLRSYMVDELGELKKGMAGVYSFTNAGKKNLFDHRGLGTKSEPAPPVPRIAPPAPPDSSRTSKDTGKKAKGMKKFGLTMTDSMDRQKALECLFGVCGRGRALRLDCLSLLKVEFPGHNANVYGKVLQGLAGRRLIETDTDRERVSLTGKGLNEIGQPIFAHQPEPAPEPEIIETIPTAPELEPEPVPIPPLPDALELRMDREDVAAVAAKLPKLLELLERDPHVITLLGELVMTQRRLVSFLMDLAVWGDHAWNKKRAPRRKRLAELEEEVKRLEAEGIFDPDTSKAILARISAELRQLSR